MSGSRRLSGIEFQAVGPATAKARRPELCWDGDAVRPEDVDWLNEGAAVTPRRRPVDSNRSDTVELDRAGSRTWWLQAYAWLAQVCRASAARCAAAATDPSRTCGYLSPCGLYTFLRCNNTQLKPTENRTSMYPLCIWKISELRIG